MEPEAKRRLKIASISGLAGFILIGGIWLHQEHIISSNQHVIHSEQVSANHHEHSGKTVTVQRVERAYDKKEPALGTDLQSNRDQVAKGARLAFNDTHKPDNLDRNLGGIKRYLGDDISDGVVKIIDPNKEGYSIFQEPRSISNYLTKCTVSYGEYNQEEHDIPMTIMIRYKTPAFPNNPQGSFSKKNDHAYAHTGHVVINATLSINNGKMEMNNLYHSVDGYDME